MCFTIPLKVIKVTDRQAHLENGKIVKLDKDINVKKGEYLRIIGNIAVDRISKFQGLKIRQLIQKMKFE
ncbi:hypothetical protein COY59_02350 [Candidatus Gottesmanbacteria bacterium CG_4_10_14_0_8_um_filter_37_24]|uniref:HypC/HybG/HupF family hydrogenase formation chaperone n=1 Tax=Candidatus Gottesmanbacteria bacterium CG_4_10_14_0_8_um_filter_37_24 TaxID=1974574 RepID=A0A2M7RS48_9BACT|nr:MAG: hypothetical protein COX23_04635 [Candidatus Gottesmanbacteria bacterium CG23_combo_of_CG06-09_8_20_14_all_37_19]PIZ02879.1 MAG: hypothetical protein COY59_02350 [Candidatus Gottesmanbacteria bacterium CG_4_10_14_0_8_um_filter_37_24]